MMKSTILLHSLLLGLTLAASPAPADPLETGFRNPPDSAKPQTWWHWMNGNITKTGITADLEAMKQIGLGGATIVNVDCDIPRGPVNFMSPEWRDDFKFAVEEANRLGLKLCVENCAGWSSSGGPWNTVTNAMQRLTSSELLISGPTNFDAELPQPHVTLGYYRDIAVLAFKTPASDSNTAVTPAKFEITRAVYGSEDGSAVIDVKSNLEGRLKSGEKSVFIGNDEMGSDPAYGQVKQLRLEFTLNGKPDTAILSEGDTLVFPTTSDAHLRKHSFGRTSVDWTFVHPPAPGLEAGEVVTRDNVIDLTSRLSPDGKLRWDVPEGRWTILRFGYTPTGVPNHPAPEEGTGLECDKFSKAALDQHWNGFMQKVLDDIGPLAGKALDSSLIDSYEVGGQDWTAKFREEFEKRRGYDPTKYLPTFTRRIVDDPAVTERFLWDMRRTVADLFADNYFGHFAELCRQHGLMNAVEPYTGPFESLQCGAPADVVMGEFWSGSQGHPSVKMAASIAHIYGKTIVGAESFTADPQNGRWQNDPYALKTLGDLMYCQGLNRYIFHRYAMQPWTNRWPGMTMGQWGFHFERTETWWKQGKAWIDYISRCEFLLQQGRAVQDVAYFTGQSAPVEMRLGHPATPAGYDYDAVNADVLLHAEVKNGRLTLASGANYAALVLPPEDINMTPEMMKCLRRLVRAGAVVVGPKPEHSPSLSDYPKCDQEVAAAAEELWGNCDGKNVLEHADGKGHVFWGKSLADIFASENLGPDFDFAGQSPSTHFAYTHRIAGATDIYFISNQRRDFDSAECTFRITGKVPELWHPETGMIEPAPIWSAQDDRIKVRVDLDPAGSVFVIFRPATEVPDHIVSVTSALAGKPSAPSSLKIERAVFAGIDGGGEADVTEKLSGMIHDGQLAVSADSGTFGHDPAVDHPKELRVDYTLDGKPGHATAREHNMLYLPDRQFIGAAPQWKLNTADAVPTVTAWSSGSVELQTASGKTLRADIGDLPAATQISGPWTLSFPPNWGAPDEVTLPELISWTDHTNAGVRYFSGTATYEKDIEIPADRFGDGRDLWLDLGAVKNFAEISLNGHDFGVLWKPPFRANITSAARPGSNKLIVKITNLWPNRLIGDEQLPPDREWRGMQLASWPQWLLDGKPSPTGRFTFTTWHHWTKDSQLLESGLIGPVILETSQSVPAK